MLTVLLVSVLPLQNFLFLNVKEVAIITLTKNGHIQIFLQIFLVSVPNAADYDVMYLTRVNRCKIYVYINNKEVILLFIAIY